MFVEFQLPHGAGGMATHLACHGIKKEIDKWANEYSIEYKTKIHKYTLRLCFEQPELYTFFELSWNPKLSWARRYQLVER